VLIYSARIIRRKKLLDKGASSSPIKSRALNFVGGLPDLVLVSMPDFTVPVNRLSREDYLKRLDFYIQLGKSRDEHDFFTLPEDAPESKSLEIRSYLDGEREIITYPSRYILANEEILGDYSRHEANLTGYINLWRHDDETDRPLVLLLHGFMMGHPLRSEQIFGVERLFESGLDVALYSLPHHWRRRKVRQRLLNPDNAPLTIETFGQNIHDLHSTILLLRKRGYERIGIIGASMGGLTASLYATMPADVDFMFMAVPAVRVDRYLTPKNRYFSFNADKEIREKTMVALDLIDPCLRKPRYDLSKIQIVMHAGDRICPSHQTRRWIKNWGIDNVVEVTGGHWLYLDRKVRGQTWRAWLQKHGYIT
jgi:hypothetical protein